MKIRVLGLCISRSIVSHCLIPLAPCRGDERFSVPSSAESSSAAFFSTTPPRRRAPSCRRAPSQRSTRRCLLPRGGRAAEDAAGASALLLTTVRTRRRRTTSRMRRVRKLKLIRGGTAVLQRRDCDRLPRRFRASGRRSPTAARSAGSSPGQQQTVRPMVCRPAAGRAGIVRTCPLAMSTVPASTARRSSGL